MLREAEKGPMWSEQIGWRAIFVKDKQVMLFCIAIQYWSSGIGIAILLWKTSNTQAIPEKFVWTKHMRCSCGHFR